MERLISLPTQPNALLNAQIFRQITTVMSVIELDTVRLFNVWR
ncbi:hypothetical protein THF5H11_400001 [Vibrio jasicida]|nr:hypothetical protein THF5H11_400001 [Vibrio jasicida]